MKSYDKVERARDIARHPVKNAEQALAHQRPDGVIGEWKNVAKEDQKFFQRIADRTYGIATPGNVVTTLGAVATLKGINHYRRGEYVKATAWTFLGRFVGDVGDGAAAAVTETRGAPGALYDATTDKVLAVVFVAAAVEKGDMSIPEAVTHALQQARSARENTRLKLAGGEPNPSKFGKWGQAMLWLEAGGIMSGHAAEELGFKEVANSLHASSEGAMYGAIILNERAADEYERRRIDHIAALTISQLS
jgi:phosphatidylglycerophosphate synthase